MSIDTPLATVITPVGMDHTEFLGDTLAQDRRRKGRHHQAQRAGDFRGAGARSDGRDRAAGAARLHAPLHAAGQEWHVNIERGRLVYQDERGLMDLAAPKLFGRHQFDNAGLAIATLRALDAFRIDAAAFRGGHRSAPNGRRGCSG